MPVLRFVIVKVKTLFFATFRIVIEFGYQNARLTIRFLGWDILISLNMDRSGINGKHCTRQSVLQRKGKEIVKTKVGLCDVYHIPYILQHTQVFIYK